jgi:hypothetical protein
MPQLVADLNWRRDTKLACLTAALPIRDGQHCTAPHGILGQNWLRDRILYFSFPSPKVNIITLLIGDFVLQFIFMNGDYLCLARNHIL